jgi:coproporphyrinogen III oxidase
MMQAGSSLIKRQKELIEKISDIKTMRWGSLNVRYNKIKKKNDDIIINGPYYNLTRTDANGKTISQTIPTSEVECVKKEVENYKKFKKLCDEYAEICEQIAITKASSIDSDDEYKKNWIMRENMNQR